jgi:hypothetical protein
VEGMCFSFYTCHILHTSQLQNQLGRRRCLFLACNVRCYEETPLQPRRSDQIHNNNHLTGERGSHHSQSIVAALDLAKQTASLNRANMPPRCCAAVASWQPYTLAPLSSLVGAALAFPPWPLRLFECCGLHRAKQGLEC